MNHRFGRPPTYKEEELELIKNFNKRRVILREATHHL